jgi:hypothetical protein
MEFFFYVISKLSSTESGAGMKLFPRHVRKHQALTLNGEKQRRASGVKEQHLIPFINACFTEMTP